MPPFFSGPAFYRSPCRGFLFGSRIHDMLGEAESRDRRVQSGLSASSDDFCGNSARADDFGLTGPLSVSQ